MDRFVSVAWLTEHLDEVVLCDLRWALDGSEGRHTYETGHLPGAVYVDVDRDLATTPSVEAGRHPLPDPATWAATVGRLGIAPGDRVVAYDNGVGAYAARLVWMLRAVGIAAAVLDGGLGAWDGPLEEGPVLRTATIVPVQPWPAAQLADADAVAVAPVVLDARDAVRFRGEDAGPDRRAGHVPGARHAPFTANVDEAGRLRPAEELRARLGPLVADATGEQPTVVYCGSGVTACHDALVLEHVGLGPVRLYAGSWSQWAGDLSRPVEVDVTPG